MYKDLMVKSFIFVAGAAAGAAVAWKIAKTKYAQIAQEEIDSVKEAFSIRKGNGDTETIDSSPADGENEKVDEDRLEYEKIVSDNKYATESEEVKEDQDMDDGKPYVIAPEEYGDCDYATVSLTIYADGIVTNEQDKIVDNVDELVGNESLTHFGEYEDDSVYVRNDKLKIDFEILKDYRDYSEIN